MDPPRYEYATTLFPESAVILDIACGVGYGSFILAEQPARKVEGVDISHESVAYAQTYYNPPNIRFLQSDAYLYDWKADTFDAIVSFETLEHAVMPFSKEKFPHHVGI